MVNKILGAVAKGLVVLGKILQPVNKALQPLWTWTDEHWYRATKKN